MEIYDGGQVHGQVLLVQGLELYIAGPYGQFLWLQTTDPDHKNEIWDILTTDHSLTTDAGCSSLPQALATDNRPP